MLQEHGPERRTDCFDEGVIYCHRARSERCASHFLSIWSGRFPLFASPFGLFGNGSWIAARR
jgi:hypothetical protein